MPYIRPEVHKAVSENDISAVVFQDPLADEARKAKRNLVAVSFGAILIAALGLQVNGFLGLQTVSGAAVGGLITRGLACIVVMYFLAAFLVSTYVDYSAWKFKRERYLVATYLDLIRMAEGHFATLGDQIKNATSRLGIVSSDRDMQAQVTASRAIADAQGQLTAIAKHTAEVRDEIRPLLSHWRDTVEKAQRLSWRLRVRFVGLWVLDILVPVCLSLLAIWRTFDGLSAVIARVAV